MFTLLHRRVVPILRYSYSSPKMQTRRSQRFQRQFSSPKGQVPRKSKELSSTSSFFRKQQEQQVDCHASYARFLWTNASNWGMLFLDHGWGSMIPWKTADSRLKNSKHTYNCQEPRRYCCSTRRLIHILQMQKEICRTPFVTHSNAHGIVRCKKSI